MHVLIKLLEDIVPVIVTFI